MRYLEVKLIFLILGRIEWAIVWPIYGNQLEPQGQLISFCNTIPTPQGGTHEAGLRQALSRSLKILENVFTTKNYNINKR